MSLQKRSPEVFYKKDVKNETLAQCFSVNLIFENLCFLTVHADPTA